MIKKLYDKLLNFPKLVLLVFTTVLLFLGSYSVQLEIDASSETLLMNDDKDLKFSREISKRYASSEFLLLTFEPKNGNLLSNESLNTIEDISKDLIKLDSIVSIKSILNVPLLESPVQPISDLIGNIKTLENRDFDEKLVKKEFTTSPLYKNNLVSEDFKTTAILLNLKDDIVHRTLLEKRNELQAKKRNNTITAQELDLLKKVTVEFKKHRDETRLYTDEQIKQIRAIVSNYKSEANIFLGGVNMIANDVVNFVKNDLLVYGTSLAFIIIFLLWFIFRNIHWVLIPVAICFLSVISTAGILGLFNLEVTVISSNFISLQLIITISIVMHLIVRYRELNKRFVHASQYKLVINTMLSKLNPSFFAIITTVTGFFSLVLSHIQPVKNLGYMMAAGVSISLFIAFIIFPLVLILMERKEEKKKENESNISLISTAIKLIEQRGSLIIVSSVVVVIFAITGASKLIVENSFINYFKKSTEIYKGMEVIDQNLGGTTPLDIVIKFKKPIEEKDDAIEEPSFLDDFLDEFSVEFSVDENDPKYWFSQDKLQTINKIHDYLNSLPEVGTVQSLSTLLKIGKRLNDGEELDGLMLALLYEKLPLEYKNLIISPYVNIENNEARISIRIIDSNPQLRRDDLINKINSDIQNMINQDTTEVRLSNLMIMYNNMLQSLFDSQISTLGFVLTLLFIMFLVLFRSLKVAIIAILANIIPISVLFGIMGWLNIPLDIMTITIAAISIGIGVDDTIHYIHRYKEEFKHDHDYKNAMIRAHQSIGYAMYYTSVVIMVGFSILVLSNLIPTIYFGLLTVVVMMSLLASALLLLPKLLILLRPYEGLKKWI